MMSKVYIKPLKSFKIENYEKYSKMIGTLNETIEKIVRGRLMLEKAQGDYYKFCRLI